MTDFNLKTSYKTTNEGFSHSEVALDRIIERLNSLLCLPFSKNFFVFGYVTVCIVQLLDRQFIISVFQ